MSEPSVRSDRPRTSAGRWLVGFTAALALVLVMGSSRRDPLLVWNASASSPRGLYVFAPGDPETGDFVFARAPAAAGALAIARRYLGPGIPLVKTVAAARGDWVCAGPGRLTINRRLVVVRRAADRLGRKLPQWSGCRALRDGELLLLGAADPASFDGRYFGPVGMDRILGRARLVWAV